MSAPLKIFIIYAREDESFKISLLKAFKPLHRTGKIEIFHDGLIKPGERWEETILENLRTAHIILPLVSTDFFDSEFIHEVEFKKAVDRYNKGETTIIPVILKHCGWKYDPVIPTLQVLPKDGKPVVTWAYHEEAWEQVLNTVHGVVELKEVAIQRKKENAKAKRRRKAAKPFFDLGMKSAPPDEKIGFFSKAIEIDPEYAEAYLNRARSRYLKGFVAELMLHHPIATINSILGLTEYLTNFHEALVDLDRSIHLNPAVDADTFNFRGLLQEKIGVLEEAKKDYQKSLSIDPNYEHAKNNLKNLEEKMKQKP